MPVCPYQKLIFIHIPKTAGQSIYQACGIEQSLSNLCGSDGAFEYSHFTGIEIRDKLGLDIFTTHFKFTVVRNPFDRLVVEYFYRRLAKDTRLIDSQKLGFRAFVSALADLDLYSFSQPERAFFIPQVDFVYDEHGVNMANQLFRFEALWELEEFLGTKLPHANRSEHRPYREYYDSQTREAAEKIYAADLEAFGYDF